MGSNQENEYNKQEQNLTAIEFPEKDITNSSLYPIYKYTKENIEKFFDSDNGQKEEHTLEESICRPLIGQQNYKPFFYYCKEDPKVENINLISIENHIRLKDPEKHKTKLLEFLEKEKENND